MPAQLGVRKQLGIVSQFIDKKVIITMVNDYLNGIGGISTERLRTIYGSTKEEAKCCTFPVSEILKLIAINKDVDAIRVYYGAHNKDNSPTGHAEYEGLHNVILVACKNVGTAANPIYLDLLKDGENYVTIAGFKDDTDDGKGLDMGNLCPPNGGCPGTTIPPQP